MFSLEDFLFKRNKVVNNWALILSHCAPEIPFRINILCVFIVLKANYCIFYVSFSLILSRVVWTVMNGICILVPQANITDGGFAKLAPLPCSFFFIIFTLIFIYLFIYYFLAWFWVLWDCPLSSNQFAMGVLGRGRGWCHECYNALLENQFQVFVIIFILTGTTQNVLKYTRLLFSCCYSMQQFIITLCMHKFSIWHPRF